MLEVRMSKYDVLMVVGSLRKESFNRRLSKALAALAPTHIAMREFRIDDIPLYNQDLEPRMPDAVQRAKREVEAAHGVLFVTPEYNRSMPGVMKNVIDWVSRPYGHSSWKGKPAAIAGTTTGAIGTAVAQSHLRSVLTILEMPLMTQPEIYLRFTEGLINDQFEFTDVSTRKLMVTFVNHFAAWVEKHSEQHAVHA
jgi:chromate reductase, NAD(P)H dehydrogenase (quinone)